VALNPGNSGGPVLNRQGKVVGVVASRLPKAAGVNFAIPVSHVRPFVETAEIEFLPPALRPESLHQPAQFQAKVVAVLPATKPLELELILTSDGKERAHKMELSEGVYRVTAAAIAVPPAPAGLKAVIRYANGSLTSLVEDRTIKVDGKDVKLNVIRSIALEGKPKVVFADGKSVVGAVSGLNDLEVQLGNQKLKLGALSPQSIQFESSATVPSVSWGVVARQNGKEVRRLTGTLNLGDQGLAGTIHPPNLEKDVMTVQLPGPVGDLAVGGGGRYLVFHVPTQHKLAIFDVNQAKIVHSVPVAEDKVFIAAGRDKLLVALVKEQVLQRWSLTTFEREATTKMDLKVPVVAVAMGSASNGPLLVEGCDWPRLGECAFFDIEKMKRLEVSFDPHGFFPTQPGVFVRASADGRVFANRSYAGVQTCAWTGKEFVKYEGECGDWPLPGPDGKMLYTARGMYSEQLKPIAGPASSLLAGPAGSVLPRAPAR
jgi:hypothetical protein